MHVDRTKYSRKCLSVQLKKDAFLRFYSNTQRPFFIIYKSKLTEMLALMQRPHVNESHFIPQLVKFEAFNLSLIDDVEFLSFLTFF